MCFHGFEHCGNYWRRCFLERLFSLKEICKHYAKLKFSRFSLSLSLSLSLKHLCYEIKKNIFVSSTALLTDKLLSSNSDLELKEFLYMIFENLKTEDAQLIRLQNEIEYLPEKVNDVERYTSKDTNIIRNLTSLSNKDVTTDVIEFIRNMLYVENTQGELVACNELGRIVDINEPPPNHS